MGDIGDYLQEGAEAFAPLGRWNLERVVGGSLIKNCRYQDGLGLLKVICIVFSHWIKQTMFLFLNYLSLEF